MDSSKIHYALDTDTQCFRDHALVVDHECGKFLILPKFQGREGVVMLVVNMKSIIHNESDNTIVLVYETLKGSYGCVSLAPVPNEEHHFWDLYGWLVKVFGLKKTTPSP
jgi:hypothetical protein